MSLSNIEINGMTYQVYASVTEADIFLEVDPIRGAGWAALSETDKGRHLVAATRRLDIESYVGDKTDPNQSLEWPRTGAECRGEAIPSDVVPKVVEYACIIIAGSLPGNANAASASTASNTGIQKLKAEGVEIEFGTYQESRSSNSFSLQDLNADAFAHIRCVLTNPGSGAFGSGRLVLTSGTGGGPSFGPAGGPVLTGGLT